MNPWIRANLSAIDSPGSFGNNSSALSLAF